MKKIVLIIILIVNLYSETLGEYIIERVYTFKQMKKEYSNFKPDIKELKDGRFRAKFYRCGGRINDYGYIYEKDKNCNIKILRTEIEFNSKGLQDGKRINYQLYPNISKKLIKTSDGYFKNGKREGAYKLYDIKGIVSSYSKYKNDKLDGLNVNYNTSTEKLIKVETYKNGKLNGPNTTYYPNGKPEHIRTYKNGKSTIPYKNYYKSGNLKIYTRFEKKLNIIVRTVYANSDKKEIMENAYFLNNYKDRKETSYSKDGKLTSIKYYNNNKEITKEEYEKLPKE